MISKMASISINEDFADLTVRCIVRRPNSEDL